MWSFRSLILFLFIYLRMQSRLLCMEELVATVRTLQRVPVPDAIAKKDAFYTATSTEEIDKWALLDELLFREERAKLSAYSGQQSYTAGAPSGQAGPSSPRGAPPVVSNGHSAGPMSLQDRPDRAPLPVPSLYGPSSAAQPFPPHINGQLSPRYGGGPPSLPPFSLGPSTGNYTHGSSVPSGIYGAPIPHANQSNPNAYGGYDGRGGYSYGHGASGGLAASYGNGHHFAPQQAASPYGAPIGGYNAAYNQGYAQGYAGNGARPSGGPSPGAGTGFGRPVPPPVPSGPTSLYGPPRTTAVPPPAPVVPPPPRDSSAAAPIEGQYKRPRVD
jgi:hypothetical protein